MVDSTDGLYVVVSGDIAPLRSALAEASSVSTKFANDLTTAFTDAALKGKQLSDVFRQLVLSLSQTALGAALSPFTKLFGNTLAQFFPNGNSTAALPLPFASGGVIASPMSFPLGGGQSGIAGEAGPEAIMPLVRGADGRLGVKSSGGGSNVTINFNVTTPDAQSFKRSQGQIAAMLNRMVARGARNL